MPRFNRALALRPINQLKHVVDTSGVTSLALPSTTELAVQVDLPSTTAVNQVHVGSAVKAIFLNVQINGSIIYSGIPRVYFLVYKNPGNQVPVPDPSNIGISPRRKFVIHQEMMMVDPVGPAASSPSSFPRTMFKGVILIPKRYQRFGDGDKLTFVIQNALGETNGQTDWCVQCIYKEFF